MKKLTALLLTFSLLLILAACGKDVPETMPALSAPMETAQTAPAETEAVPAETAASSESTISGGKSLVVYFTYGENAELSESVDASSSASIQRWGSELTGNTGLVAHMIQDATGADIFSIRTAEKYPSTYDATIDQGQAENRANARPVLEGHIENLDDYDTIFLGFPNWWYDMPMAMYSFLEEYDLGGKTIAPFVTSGGSGFSGSIETIRSLEPGATVLEELSIGASSAAGAQEQVNTWLAELGVGLG